MFQPVICNQKFRMVYLVVLRKKIYWMMITFEVTTMLVNLAMQLTMKAGVPVFVINTLDISDDKTYSLKLEKEQLSVYSSLYLPIIVLSEDI